MKKTTKHAPAAEREIVNKTAETQFGLPDRAVIIPRLLRKS